MNKTILVVEDERSILELLSEVLSEGGRYEVLGTGDGESGLQMIHEHGPAVVILDVQLPGISGLDVCKAVKANPALSSTKVLMLTGFAQQADEREARARGADAYVRKPFSSVVLMREIELLATTG